MGRDDDQIPALLLGLPECLPGLNAKLLGFVIFRQDDTMAVFYITTNSNRMPAELWIQHTLDTGIKVVHVAMQDHALHDGQSFLFDNK